MIESYGKGGPVIFWQQPKSEDNPIGEPAIVLKKYIGTLQLSQEGRTIIITDEVIPEFIRAIRLAMQGEV